jgi:hypothetical protein
VEPASVGVGDAFTYVVEVRVDTETLDARTVRVIADTGSFATIGPSRSSRSSGRIRLVQTLACLDRACAPLDGAREIRLPAPRATASRASATAAPVSVRVAPRVPASAVDAPRAEYRRETALPAPTSFAAAGWAGGLAALVALALVLTAVALILLELRPRPSGPEATQNRLARALRLLRESAGRSEPDRRRAAGLLARVLVDRGADPLADEATRVAWSEHRPGPPDAETLAAHVEGTFGSKS